jgi:uncharacterized membrane protein YfcA
VIYALLGAVAVGLVLGLLGSGGSILTVPVLVYLVGEPEKVAIAESLAIVGAIAAVGAVPYARQRRVDGRSVLLFGGPGLVGASLGAVLSRAVPGAFQLALFAVVMLLAAWRMLRGAGVREGGAGGRAPAAVAALGLGVGVLTGLVGVGGGFLIVPALVLLVGLPMRAAVGTSLAIVALNSATGFATHVGGGLAGGAVDWRLVGAFAAIGIAGSLLGHRLSERVPQGQLRRAFGVFLVVMGAFILAREGPRALGGAPAATAPSASAPSASASRLPPP